MDQTVTPRTKYLELPQEMRNRIVSIYSVGANIKRKMQEIDIPMVDEIEYRDIANELEVVRIETAEIKAKIQEKLSHLEEVRDYVKEVTSDKKEQRRGYLADMIRKEIKKADTQLAILEEKMHVLAGDKKMNALQLIQRKINSLSKKMECI